MRNIFVILFVLFSVHSYAQDSVVVVLKINDSKHDESIRNAKVEFEVADSSYTYISNSRGVVYFKILNEGHVFFTISHYKYHEITSKKKISSKTDSLFFHFKMNYIREQNVQEMVVSAPGIPQVVYGSGRLHVSDFEILNNGDLLLLTYPKQLKKGSQLLIYDGKKVKSSFEVPHKAEELIHDFRGNAHVVCEKDVLGIHILENQIGISKLDRSYFMKYISPIVDTNKSKMYFSTFNKDYPAFDYYSFDQLDSTYSKILEIEDELMMELYRSEIKWVDVRTRLWAKNKEIQSGVDAETWVGANYFTQSVYYKELYAPMFQRNDTLYVFDYYKDKLRSFDELGNKIDSVSIYHHYNKRKTGWKKELVQDRKTGQIYAVFDRAGYTYIGWVDTKSGEITEQVKLEYRYVHDVAVYNNQVYYIYRPYESAQKKFLYKERLPYDFGSAGVAEGEIIHL